MTESESAAGANTFRPPSIEELVSDSRYEPWIDVLTRPLITRIIQDCVKDLRGDKHASEASLHAHIKSRLEFWDRVETKSVVNATGVLLHTNLGRAPHDEAYLSEITRALSGYASVEFDLDKGDRGKRGTMVHRQIAELAGADAGLMVNNCASAVLLMLSLAQGKSVIVSRGELVQIGGGFRIPDIMAQSGATLIEVGTTNRTTLEDYTKALSDTSAAILKVHRSNFYMSGFVDEVSPKELRPVCRKHDLLLLEDLGSGAVHDLSRYGLPRERTWSDAIRDGSDLVSISGDKLLGGSQAGLLAGSTEAIARAAGHPLYRALRPGKMALAAMSVTLRAHLSGRHEDVLPLYRLLATDVEALRNRAAAIIESVKQDALEMKVSETLAGGGTLPQAKLPSISMVATVDSPDRALTVLRNLQTPVIARVQNDQVWFDLKTVFPDQDSLLVRAIAAILK